VLYSLKGVGLLVPLAPIITMNLVDNLTGHSIFLIYNFVLQITMVSLRWLAHVTLVRTIISSLLVLCSVYMTYSNFFISGTGCCWSRNASDFAKTSCGQSLQAFFAGNSLILRIFFIQYLWGKYLRTWKPWMVHLSLVVFLALMALLTELSFLICMKKPSALNMPAIQGWLQSVLGAKDFIHLMFSLLLVTSQLHLKSEIHFFLSCMFMIMISVCCFYICL
jgi:hypothetical protein